MQRNYLYPVFLALGSAKCLISGFGNVGRRKLIGLQQASPAAIVVCDPQNPDNFDQASMRILLSPNVIYRARSWKMADLDNVSLAFGCSSDPDSNKALMEECRKRNIFCNCATEPQDGNMQIPATARAGELVLALGTGGASPLLARLWRNELGQWLEDKAPYAWFMGRLRSAILKAGHASATNRQLFLAVVDSPISIWLKEKEFAKCEAWLLNNIPELGPAEIGKIINDYRTFFTV